MSNTKKNCLNLAVALSIALAVLGFRLQMIHDHGLQFPINDQWYSEYNNLYKPYLDGHLSLRDFFKPNNEHVVAIQKGIHLALLVALGEWNTMAQMFLNAFLFSVLVFFGSLMVGIFLGMVPSFVLQLTILACALMPGPAENFLFGFQTGWYVYYFASGVTLFCLSKSKKFDLWWLTAWLFSILSCLCLASGIGNLFLCVVAPSLRKWMLRAPQKQLLSRSVPYFILCLPAILFFFKIAIEGRPKLPQSDQSLFENLIEIFSYPLGLLPITYLPILIGLWMVIYRPPIPNGGLIRFPFLFALWALMHATMLSAGRGGFSGRHTELLLFGILANLLLILVLRPIFHEPGLAWMRRIPIFWVAAILGGLAFRGVESRQKPREFADLFLPKYELLKESVILENTSILTSRNWDTGLPAGLFGSRPDLLHDPLVQKIAPSFFTSGIHLAPEPRNDLLVESIQMFPTPFPFLLWAKINGSGSTLKSETFSAKGFSHPYVKIVFAGRWEAPFTGIYDDPASTHRLGMKKPFSQAEGWRAVFLPVKNGVVEFTAKVKGDRDWLLLQQPIPASRLQVAMEFVGRQAWRIWAFFLGLSIFLMVVRFSLALPFSKTQGLEIS